MNIAITGATGHLGRLVIEKLQKKVPSNNLVALARSPEKIKNTDIEVRKFDYQESAPLSKQLQNIDTLLLISANDLNGRALLHKNVINAAKNAGIKWIIYTSLLHADSTTLGLAKDHTDTEKAIRESGIPYTILRNGWYTENYTGSIPAALKNGAFKGCASNGKISSASRSDYADAAVAVLTGLNQQGRVYELAGDTAFTLSELAAEVTKLSGKNVPYKNMTEKEYSEVLIKSGLPGAYAKAVASWDTSASRGDLFDDSHELSRLIGRATTPMHETVLNVIEHDIHQVV